MSKRSPSPAKEANSPKEAKTESVRIVGRCFCESCEFVADGPVSSCGVCHCKFCRATTGAAFTVAVGYKAGDVTWTKSDTLTRFMQREDMGLRRLFCSKCGTHLGAEMSSMDTYWLNYSVIKEGTPPKLGRHCNLESKADWYELPEDGLPRAQRQ
eukprot:TRINITY_DN5016_c0_g1_i3.p1 TRINITY_DN5016_c0_g1~~TRINITY_DN5016_c0_g1_i3.p1  ORF type:complete len:165 (+),score=23.09 TRINITY_DN5016_c0_g1_i3:33-497(+)